jgi:transcriptional regulator with XRE-family HTH domain
MKTEKRSSIIERFRENIKDENRLYVAKNIQISNQISEILDRKGLSQKDFAKLLDKHESEISKILSGLHNLTLKTITKMEAVLGEDIILTPAEARMKFTQVKYVTLKVSANKNHSAGIDGDFVKSKYQDHNNEEKAA